MSSTIVPYLQHFQIIQIKQSRSIFYYYMNRLFQLYFLTELQNYLELCYTLSKLGFLCYQYDLLNTYTIQTTLTWYISLGNQNK